ncbi:hypothetical protein BDY21DRAFT_424530 [Lineolata rhizophorae]|uniref:CMP/dCMP-type deaminase domain-containing protein n=1 Tax=Lineolata rhizophorae TaxID=578093 RepID=A0A6A6NPA5_9PEZI|nr:hypothetical protein BDY21DRAFT_424530 [Lineolata rhizophorae]
MRYGYSKKPDNFCLPRGQQNSDKTLEYCISTMTFPDNYLTLCLEQASKSPLHYRHGCIIVRGGKVIGQGYNDYRPGFDGGALKTGRIGTGSGGSANPPDAEQDPVADHKRKKKLNPKNSSNGRSGAFTPFEVMLGGGGGGGGPNANTPLSMHSEMMAVHSALAGSACLAAASSAPRLRKPCFKLPGGSKRKARLWRAVLAGYVERVGAGRGGRERAAEAQGQGWRFEAAAFGPVQGQTGDEGEEWSLSISISAPTSVSVRPFFGCGCSITSSTPPSSAKKDAGSKPNYRPCYNESMHSYKDNPPNQSSTASSQPMLLPKGRTGQNNNSISARTKDPRLNGADLYVARLGLDKAISARTKTSHPSPPIRAAPSDADQPASELGSHGSGSLHDELKCPHPRSIRRPPKIPETYDRRIIRSSRPCYRCVSYMQSVGIKRVFWTNDSGEWEGGKVRDLVDALEAGSGRDADGTMLGGSAGNGVFVTKHEVLILRRRMGGG